MKKHIVLAALLAVSAGAGAQNIYQLESFSNADLNGTARYVGMGGAMNALGADLSVMSSNPAGIGLYRKSDVAVTLGAATQQDATKFYGKSGSHMSFDNLGFVYALPMDGGATQFVNIGLNYRKHKDFNTLLNTGMTFEGTDGGASQTWQMSDLADYWGDDMLTPLAKSGYETWLYEGDNVHNSKANEYHKAQWGSIQDYDVSLGFNFNDRWYLGLAVGLYNVGLNSYSMYSEDLLGKNTAGVYEAGTYYLSNRNKLTGTGVDFKAGFIIRPIEDNPFRIGFSFSTPTYYSLRSRKVSSLISPLNEDGTTVGSSYGYDIDYEYNLYTPWKFNFSLGTTFFKQLAIGAEYEYSDYSCAKISYDNGYVGDWGDDEDDDEALKQEADKRLKGVSTFKLGMEWYVDPQLAIRLGYNYVSTPMKKNAWYNQFINSASLDYATSTAYMNMSDIHRLTVGIGTNFGNFYADFAYMYQIQNGDFFAFNTQNGYDNQPNDLPATHIKLNRSKVMFTLGYRF